MLTRSKKLQEGGELLLEDLEIGVKRRKKQPHDLVMGENKKYNETEAKL
jgi:hypothetical protein